MSKRREQPEIEEDLTETAEAEVAVIEAPPEATPTPFDSYPDDLKQIAVAEYQTALNTGMKQGDAEAAARRTARKWAREHNRRMPE